jgi:hypothetical protein
MCVVGDGRRACWKLCLGTAECFTAGAFYTIFATLKGKNSTRSDSRLQEEFISVNA